MTKTAMRVAVWTGAAVLAAGVATAAVAASRTGGGGVLSPEDVAAQLAADNAGTGGADDPAGDDHGDDADGIGSTTSPSAPSDASVSRVVKTTGGTMVVKCQGNVATLVSWTPNTGYRADDPVRGPAAKVALKFESDTSDDVMVSVTCADGQAVKKETVEADDHGGGNGGGGNGGVSDDPPGDDHGGGSGGGGSDD
jgi:hypothetical protein